MFVRLVLAGCFALLCAQCTAQESRFEKMREWADSTGKFKVQAKLSSLSSDTVTIEKEDGNRSTIPIQRLSEDDQEFLKKYKKDVFSKLKAKTRESVLAKDIVNDCQTYLDKGFADEEQAKFANDLIKTHSSNAEKSAIILPKEVVSDEQLKQRRDEANKAVSKWVATKRGKDERPLKAATVTDPTNLEANILLSLYAELHEADFRGSQKYLNDAIKRCEKYQPIATQHDNANLVIALNNLAVSYARSNQVPKALRAWMSADKYSDYELPEDVKWNIAKMARMLKDQRSGVITDRSSRADIEEFVTETESTGSLGGWKLLCPHDIEGDVRGELSFMIANRDAQELVGSVFQDTRCVKCVGHTKIGCLNRKCKNGQVEKPIYGQKKVVFPDGTVQNTGYGIIQVDRVACPNCSGTGAITCPCCYSGMQRN